MKILSKGVKPRRQLWNGRCITEGMFWGDLCGVEALDSRFLPDKEMKSWANEPIFFNPTKMETHRTEKISYGHLLECTKALRQNSLIVPQPWDVSIIVRMYIQIKKLRLRKGG